MGLFGGGNTKTTANTDNSSRQNQGQFAGMGDDNWIDVESVDSEVTGQAMDALESGVSDAFNFAEDTADSAFSFAKSNSDDAFDFGETAIEGMEGLAADAFEFGESGFELGEHALSKMEDVTAEAFDFGADVVSDFTNSHENIIGDSFVTIEDIAGQSLDLGADSIEALRKSNIANMEVMTSLVSNQTATNRHQMDTVAQLAKNTTETAATGGQSVVAEHSSKMLMYVMGGFAVVAVSLVGFALVKGK